MYMLNTLLARGFLKKLMCMSSHLFVSEYRNVSSHNIQVTKDILICFWSIGC